MTKSSKEFFQEEVQNILLRQLLYHHLPIRRKSHHFRKAQENHALKRINDSIFKSSLP